MLNSGNYNLVYEFYNEAGEQVYKTDEIVAGEVEEVDLSESYEVGTTPATVIIQPVSVTTHEPSSSAGEYKITLTIQ